MAKTKFFTSSYRIPQPLYDAVKSAAKKERRSVNSWLILQLEKALHHTPVTEITTERKSA